MGDVDRMNGPGRDLRGCGALVFGGASGLGAATVRALARRGAQVVVADRDRDLASRVADEVGGIPSVADVTVSAEVETAIDRAVESPRGLRILVNCAGVAAGTRLIERDGPGQLD